MPLVTREAFFAASKPKIKQVHIESLGEDIFIRTLSGAQRAGLGDALRKLGENADVSSQTREFVCRGVAQAIVDESGARLFSDDDIALIAEMDSTTLDELAREVLRASGLNPNAVTEAKNASTPTQSAVSASA